MDSNELKDRTKKFALRVIKLNEELSNSKMGQVLGGQLLGPELLLAQITGLLAVQNQILFVKYKLLKKRWMNLHIG